MGYTIFVAEQPPKKSTPNVGKTQTPTPTLRQICALYARSAAEGRISARSSSKTSGCDLILRGTAGWRITMLGGMGLYINKDIKV